MINEDHSRMKKAARERKLLVEKGWKLGIQGMAYLDNQLLKDWIAKVEAERKPRRLNQN